MATKKDVLSVYDANPSWSSVQIAAALGCSAGYVRATLSRNGRSLETTKPAGRRLQEWEQQAVIDAYEDGEKLEAVAAEFGVTKYCISKAALRAGLPRRDFRKSA